MIGYAAENHIASICNISGLQVNRSEQDSTGWDLKVEEIKSYPADSFVDEQPASFECEIQVKATKGKSNKVSLKLSSAYRISRKNTPTFFILVKYNKANTIQKVLIKHIDTKTIEKVLRRVRESGEKEESHLLHKQKISIDFSNAIQLTPENDIKEALLSFVPQGMDTYIKQKMELLKTLGCEGSGATMSLTLNSETGDINTDFAKLFTGEIDHVNVVEAQTTLTKFGIPNTTDIPKSKLPAKLSIAEILPTAREHICFREGELGIPKEIECSIYLPPAELMSNNLDIFRCRVSTTNFDFIFRKGSMSFTMKFMGEKSQNVEELSRELWIYERIRAGSSLIMELKRDGTYHKLASIYQEDIEIADLSSELETCRKCLEILRSLDLSTKTISTSLTELMTIRQQLDLFYAVIFSDVKNISIKITGEHNINFIREANYAIVLGAKIKIENHFFSYVFSINWKDKDIVHLEDGFCFSANSITKSEVLQGTKDKILEYDQLPALENLHRDLIKRGVNAYIRAPDI